MKQLSPNGLNLDEINSHPPRFWVKLKAKALVVSMKHSESIQVLFRRFFIYLGLSAGSEN